MPLAHAQLIVFFLLLRNVRGSGYCYDASQCVNDIGYDLSQVECKGFQSCVGLINASVSNIAYCNGAESCINITQPALQTPIYINCFGYASCANSILKTSKDVWCYGENSCQNSDLVLVSTSAKDDDYNRLFSNYFYIECYGLSSCAFTNLILDNSKINDYYENYDYNISAGDTDVIVGTASIYGYGTYALYSSIINATNIKMDLFLYGYYSGYNLTVFCGSSMEYLCTIYCNDFNSCENLNVICLSDDYCQIKYVSDNSTYIGSININSNNNDAGEEGFNLDYQSSKNGGSNAVCETDDSDIDNTNTNVTIFICDDYLECKNDDLNWDSRNSHDSKNGGLRSIICCEGDSSCQETEMKQYSNLDTIRCDGQRSCYSSQMEIDLNSSLLTINYNYKNNINHEIYCAGYESCCCQTSINISSNIINNNNNCNDNDATVYCHGYDACVQANIRNANNVICGGYSGCGGSTIQGVNNTFLYGFAAVTSYTEIHSHSGNNNNNNINNNISNVMNVYFCNNINVEQTQVNIPNIYCYNNDICNIYCLDSLSCNDFSIICPNTTTGTGISSNNKTCDNVNIFYDDAYDFNSNSNYYKFVKQKCMQFAPRVPIYKSKQRDSTTLGEINTTSIVIIPKHDEDGANGNSIIKLVIILGVITLVIFVGLVLLICGIKKQCYFKQKVYDQVETVRQSSINDQQEDENENDFNILHVS